jgi:hypothetical protein
MSDSSNRIQYSASIAASNADAASLSGEPLCTAPVPNAGNAPNVMINANTRRKDTLAIHFFFLLSNFLPPFYRIAFFFWERTVSSAPERNPKYYCCSQG